jgi:metal-responsive CopG/Arc/MetJ family transcriptional regulator
MATKKIIQVPAEPELIQALDKVAKERGLPRAEIIRDACKKMLQKLEEDELDRQYKEGYKRIPDDGEFAEAAWKALAEVLEPEDWS